MQSLHSRQLNGWPDGWVVIWESLNQQLLSHQGSPVIVISHLHVSPLIHISTTKSSLLDLALRNNNGKKCIGIAIHNSQKWPVTLQPRFVLAFVTAGSAVHSKWYSVYHQGSEKKKKKQSSARHWYRLLKARLSRNYFFISFEFKCSFTCIGCICFFTLRCKVYTNPRCEWFP